MLTIPVPTFYFVGSLQKMISEDKWCGLGFEVLGGSRMADDIPKDPM